MAYDKVTLKRFHDRWRKFDARTALGCRQKKVLYDRELAVSAWEAYAELFRELGMEPPQSPL
jgi:hypothetical protein